MALSQIMTYFSFTKYQSQMSSIPGGLREPGHLRLSALLSSAPVSSPLRFLHGPQTVTGAPDFSGCFKKEGATEGED